MRVENHIEEPPLNIQIFTKYLSQGIYEQLARVLRQPNPSEILTPEFVYGIVKDETQKVFGHMKQKK